MRCELDAKSHALIAAGVKTGVMFIMSDQTTLARIEMGLDDVPEVGADVKRFSGNACLHRAGRPAGYELWVGCHLALHGNLTLKPRDGSNDLPLEPADYVVGATVSFQFVFHHRPHG